jgi:ABC-type transporter Mla MlaB component
MSWTIGIPETMPTPAATVILRSQGDLQGKRVEELRRSWRRLRDVAAETEIRLELGHVHAIDPAGTALLREMRRRGVAIRARGGLTEAARPQRARVVAFRPRVRVVAPAVARPAFVPPTGSGVLIRLAERRVSSDRPRESSEGACFIVTVAVTLLSIVVWGCLR